MTICLDYDGSYNRFPELFEMIIDFSLRKGYKVIMATMRYYEEMDDGLNELAKRMPVYFTERKAKAPFLEDLGIFPDLWIDDKPHWLFQDSI